MNGRIITLVSAMAMLGAMAYEIEVGGEFAAGDAKGAPAAWTLHEWEGYRPFADVAVVEPGVCRLWNAKGKSGAGLRSEKRFPLAKDELVSVSFEARGSGRGGVTLYQWTDKDSWVGPAGEREFALTPNWREQRFVFTGRDGAKAATALASVVLQIRPGADAEFRKLHVERRLVTSRTLAADDFEDRAAKRPGAPELITDHIAPGLLSPTGQGVYHTVSEVALVPEEMRPFPAAAHEFFSSSVRIYAFGRDRRQDGRLVTTYGLGGETFALAVEHRAAEKTLACVFSDGRSVKVPYSSLPADFVFSASPSGLYDLRVTSLSDSSVHGVSGEAAFFKKAAGRQVTRRVAFASRGGEVSVDNLALTLAVPERAGKLEYPYTARPEMTFDPVQAGWKLVFEDNFDGKEMDPAKWEMPPSKIEKQKKYAKLEDGKLKIFADRLPGSDKLATTGFWSVPDLGYGYFEAKVKFTTYNGWWAAFWLCQSGMSNPFLDGFEIDIFEDYYLRNNERNKNDHNLHVRGAGVLKSWNYNSTLTRTHRDWYRIAAKWTPFEITYYLDGQAIPSHAVHSPYSTVTFDAFRHTAGIIPLKAIVSGQIMKTAYGKHEPTPDEVFPEAFEVDYVRVWQWPGCEPGAAPEVTFDSGAKSHYRLAYGQNVDIRATVKPAAKTGAKIKAVHLFDDGFHLATCTKPPYDFVVPMTSDYFDRTAWTRPGRSGERAVFEGSTHVFCVFAEDENGMVGHSDVMEFMLAPRAISTPYQGVAQKIPGKVVIGRYDEGGRGIAYYDATDAHVGNSGNWRPDDAVDGGEHVIGSVSSGEWVNYTVDVEATGRYLLKFSYGTPDSAKRCKVRVLVDGERTAEMKDFKTHAAANWNTDTIATTELDLAAGRHVLTFQFTGSYNVGDMEFERVMPYYLRDFVMTESDAGGVARFGDGERVAFYGDSITHGGRYVADLQLFQSLRRPGKGTRLLNVGVSGDSAGGGNLRLDWDLLARRPNRVFIMFGMNDVGRGNYETASPDAKTAAARARSLAGYEANMRKLVAALAERKLKIVPMTPSPYDQYTTAATAKNAVQCNEPGLATCAQIVRKLAAERNLGVVELHANLTQIQKDHADVVFCRDRVHPAAEGHLLIMAQILEAMHEDPVVAQVSIEADTGRVWPRANARNKPETKNAVVSDAKKRTDGGIAFTYAPKALPLPATKAYLEADKYYPLTSRFNQEIFFVAGLPAGNWELCFDGVTVGTFSAEAFAKGVNVAMLKTPNQLRAQEAAATLAKYVGVEGKLRTLAAQDFRLKRAKVDPADFAAADANIAKFLADQEARKSPTLAYYRSVTKSYRELRTSRRELAESSDDLFAQLDAVRPLVSRVTIRRAK